MSKDRVWEYCPICDLKFANAYTKYMHVTSIKHQIKEKEKRNEELEKTIAELKERIKNENGKVLGKML